VTVHNISYDFLIIKDLGFVHVAVVAVSIILFTIMSRVAKEIQWTPAFFLLGAKNEAVIHLNLVVSYNSFT
jgi:multisubunit Na+/H+ antiporter MnhB subunit